MSIIIIFLNTVCVNSSLKHIFDLHRTRQLLGNKSVLVNYGLHVAQNFTVFWSGKRC